MLTIKLQSLVVFLCMAASLTDAFQHAPFGTSTAGSVSKLNLPMPTTTLQRQHQSAVATSTTQQHAVMEIVGVSPEPIHTAFAIATFLPQPFWVLLTLFPNTGVTKKIMGSLNIVLLCSLLHFFIVVTSIVQGGSEATAPLSEFNDVFDPNGDPQRAFMSMVTNYPNFVAEEWPHVLTWDLFVGRWIWLDGLRRGIFTPHSVLLTNLIGPPGFLLHWLTCVVTGKGLVGNEAEDIP